MRIDRLDLNLLVVFDTIYIEGNITRAAKILNMAQPSVSNALSRLREVYDDPLFVRSGWGVVPTPLAQQLIAPIRQSLKLIRSSLETTHVFDPMESERAFALSVGEVFCAEMLPLLLSELEQKAPKVSLQIFKMERRRIPEELALGNLDLAIDVPQLSHRTLNRQLLVHGDFVCVLRKGHPSERSKMTMKKFLSLQHMVVSSRPSGLSMSELVSNRLGEPIVPKVRLQHYLPAFQALSTTDCVMVGPRMLAEQYDVVIKELPFDQDTTESWMYWHAGSEEDPEIKWLRQILASLFAA